MAVSLGRRRCDMHISGVCIIMVKNQTSHTRRNIVKESIFKQIDLQCPVCLNEQPCTIWEVIEAETDPDLKDKLLKKELVSQVCSNCGHLWIPAIPLLYRDASHKLLVYCHTGLSETDVQLALDKLPGVDGWMMRLVPEYNTLNEKIHIVDHNCDDRLIELIKQAVRRQGEDQNDAKIDQVYFLTANDEAFRFLALDQNGQWFSLDLEAGVYLNAEAITQGRLDSDRGRWMIVDDAYGKNLLKQLADSD